MNPLAAVCPCGHGAFMHRSQAQIDANRADGKRYVGECTGHNARGWCCQCQVNREAVMDASATERSTP